MESDFRTRLGGMLQDAREHAGLSQAALAQQLGCDQSLVSRVERAHRSLSTEELLLWAEKLGLDQVGFMSSVAAEWQASRRGSRSIWVEEVTPHG